MENSQHQRIILLSQDALQDKFVSEKWSERFAASDCQSKEKKVTLDKWKTTTSMRRKTFHNKVTGHRAVTREFLKDGARQMIVLSLEDETGRYVYNGIPATI
jgi:hypothetical protein